MILIVCIDKKYGMMFNGRRQSRDRVLTERILQITQGKPLYVSPYSASLFPAERTLPLSQRAQAQADAYYFAEDLPLPEEIDGAILFHWNRNYPADRFFSPELLEKNALSKTSQEEFVGSSHDAVTMEIYEKENLK